MDQVDQIKQKIDIVSLLSEFIPLKKMGRNFKALCPFHGEKTPSFVISPERQIWHCFSCQKGGDAYAFLMEYEHIDFPEALRILAERTGIKLENQHFDSAAVSKKELIYTLNRLSAEFYHYLLTKHKIGKAALEYLAQERKIKSSVMETFLLGFAPKSGNALTTYLIKKKGYKTDDLINAGLSYQRGQVVVDFFQGRVIFPLFDHRGNIVGFSGRVMREEDHPSKYINTRETLVYHKGMTFFGMPTAKEEMKKSENVFLMEGEFDVISSFQEGIVNTVAVKGTALTPDQVTLLSRFVKRVALCFDMDRAGQEALRRSVPLLERKGLVTSVVIFTQGKDADEAIKENVVGFKIAMKNPTGVYDFLLSEALKTNNPETADGKMRISQAVLPLFSEIENQIVREHYLQKLAQVLNTSSEAIEREIEKIKKTQVLPRPVDGMIKIEKKREEILEEYLVAVILQNEEPQRLLETLDIFLNEYKWRLPVLEKLVEHLLVYCKAHEVFSGKEFVISLPQELLPAFDSCFLLPIPKFDSLKIAREEIIKVSKELYVRYIKLEIKKIGDGIKQNERNGGVDSINILEEKLTHFILLLGKKS